MRFLQTTQKRSLLKRGLYVALLLAIVLWTLIARPGSLQAQAGALVRVEPSQVTLNPGQNTRISITIAGAESVYGLEIHLAFDPAIFQVIDADASTDGVQILPGDFLDEGLGFPVANRVDNDTGEMLYAMTLLSPAPPVSGSGTLITFDIQGRYSGATTVELAEVLLASTEGEALRLTSENGRVTVTGNQPATPSATSPPVTATATSTTIPRTTATATMRPVDTDPTAMATSRPPSFVASPTTPVEAGAPAESSPSTTAEVTRDASSSNSVEDRTPVAAVAQTATTPAEEGSVAEASPSAAEAAGGTAGAGTLGESTIEAIEGGPGGALETAGEGPSGNSTGLIITVLLAAVLLLAVAVFFWKRAIKDEKKEVQS